MTISFHDTSSVGLRQQLDPSQRMLAEATERLASGLRINRAADDASGQAAATTLSARARSWRVAERSIEAGIDVAATASGGLGDIVDALIRLRELATQAANGTLDDAQRELLQIEAGGIARQIDEIAASSKYNGHVLLAPHRVDVAFVFDSSGSMGGELATLVSSVQAFRTTLTTGGVDAQFGLADVRDTVDAIDGLRRLADLGAPGFDAALTGVTLAGGLIDPYSAILETSGATSIAGQSDPDAFSWSPASAERHVVYISDAARETDLVPGPDTQASIGAAVGSRGIAVHAITPWEPLFDVVTSTTGGTSNPIGDASGSGIPVALQAIADAIVDRAPTGTLTIQTGISGRADDWVDSGLPVDATSGGLGLTGQSIATQADARDALATIDAALDVVAAQQARVGALSRRLEAAVAEARVSHHASESTRSRIEDVDLAEAETQRVGAAIRVEGAAETLVRAAHIRRDAIVALLAR